MIVVVGRSRSTSGDAMQVLVCVVSLTSLLQAPFIVVYIWIRVKSNSLFSLTELGASYDGAAALSQVSCGAVDDGALFQAQV